MDFDSDASGTYKTGSDIDEWHNPNEWPAGIVINERGTYQYKAKGIGQRAGAKLVHSTICCYLM